MRQEVQEEATGGDWGHLHPLIVERNCMFCTTANPEEQEENEDYGVYYSAGPEGERVEIESVVRDFNPDYEAEGAPDDDHSIIRDLNSAYTAGEQEQWN